MTTRHQKAYTSQDISAYKFIAELKWQKKYSCRKCRNTSFYEGRTPFSRRCTICKDEESVTANTVFDKVRMPLIVANYIIELMCTKNRRPVFLEYCNEIKSKFNYSITPKGLGQFFSKIVMVMKNPVPRFSGNVTIMVHKHREAKIMTVFSLKKFYSQPIASTGTGAYKRQDVDDFIMKFISPNAKAPIKNFDGFLSNKNGLIVSKSNRRNLFVEDNLPFIELISEIEGYIFGFHYVDAKQNLQPGLDYFLFFKNGYTYSDLMNRLTKDYSKYSRRS